MKNKSQLSLQRSTLVTFLGSLLVLIIASPFFISSILAQDETEEVENFLFLPFILKNSNLIIDPPNSTPEPTESIEPTVEPTVTGTVDLITLTPSITPTPVNTLIPVESPPPVNTLVPSPTPTLLPNLNLALGKPAFQSSTAFGGAAGYAVDGNTDGTFDNGSVSQTELETEPWWQVNLAPSPLRLETVLLDSVNGDWQTITLQQTYTSMVVACTQTYANNTVPTVIRLRNTFGQNFDIKLQNPGDGAPVLADKVTCLVVEEGNWTLPGGFMIEAQKYVAPSPSSTGNWRSDAQTLVNDFTNPVILGQVMSSNDPKWSTFWSRGSTRGTAPSADSLFTGYHTGQDPEPERAAETIGFIALEAGPGTIDGVSYLSGITEAAVNGIENSPNPNLVPLSPAFGAAPNGALLNQTAQIGGDGSWAFLTADPEANQLSAKLDEDQLGDAERSHTLEQVAYFVFESPLLIQPSDTSQTGNELYQIDEISLFNRTDCCSENLSGVQIFISTADMSNRTLADLRADTTVWKSGVTGEINETTTVPVNQTGRFIKIHLEGNSILALAEVQVFGSQVTDGETILQVGQISADTNAIEASGQTVVYLVQRSGDLAAASYPFTIVTDGGATANEAAAFVMAESGLQLTGRSAAAPEDYLLKDSNGNLLNGTLPFVAGQATAQLVIEPVVDNAPEVPELLQIEFNPIPNAEIRYTNDIRVTLIDDEPGIRPGNRLFVGQFEPENGAGTTAYGYVTVRLSGDNRYGMVDATFSGLTSIQTAAHVHIANPESGPIAFSLPNGQFEDIQWGINAAHHLTTDQAMLDALLAGGLYINVHSANYPAGEIKAVLIEQDGSQNPTFNYPPPPYETLTGDALTQDIYRFLSQATFGPTPAMVADLEQRVANNGGDRIAAYNAWIDEQFGMNAPSHVDYYNASRLSYVDGLTGNALNNAVNSNDRFHAHHGGWLVASIYGKAQLRERTAFALSEIMVASPINGRLQGAVAGYNDTLKTHAFGDLDTLLYHVSRHPLMGHWLSHFKNRQTTVDNNGNIIASPDENYAREIMQLFSIGLLELHPDGTLKLDENGLPIETYTQGDITELARVFTGWGKRSELDPNHTDLFSPAPLLNNTNFNANYSNTRNYIYVPDQMEPMKQFGNFHDTGSKVVLGYSFPAGQNGETELQQVTQLLSDHPNSGPFIAYRMIQRLTTSNPSAGYIYRVTQAYEDSDNNLGEMVRAILLDPEARNLQPAATVGSGRIREPLVQWVTFCRFASCSSDVDATYSMDALTGFGLTNGQRNRYEAEAARIFVTQGVFAGNQGIMQAPLNAPTVFNWFEPDFSPAGPIAEAGLTAPELQHFTESLAVSYYNLMNGSILGNGPTAYFPQPGADRPRLVTELPQPMIDAYMAVMDSDSNGVMNESDAAFSDPAKAREASAAIVDVADLYLCGGWLQNEATGNLLTDPREIMIEGTYDGFDQFDDRTPADAITARDRRIREVILFAMVAPQCNVQR